MEQQPIYDHIDPPAKADRLGSLQSLIHAIEGDRLPPHGYDQRPPEAGKPLLEGLSLLEGCGEGQTRTASCLGVWLDAIRDQTVSEERPILWISPRQAVREHGLPFGPGLLDWGIAPEHMILITPKTAQDALWTAEEGLKSGCLAGVIVENQDMDLTASRRLRLAAKEGSCPCMAISTAADPKAMTVPGADARWQILSVSSPDPTYAKTRDTVGRPTLTLRCERHRHHREGTSFTTEYSHETSYLRPAAELGHQSLAKGTDQENYSQDRAHFATA